MNNNEMNETDKKILQSRLKERRLFLDMTYQDLADKTGLSKSTLQRYETGGIKSLPYDRIFVLSDALEVCPDYFTDLSKDYTGESISDTAPTSAPGRLASLNRGELFDKKAIQQITPTLISNGYSVEQYDRGSIGDLVAIKGSEIWHIDFLYDINRNSHSRRAGISRQNFYIRLGRLAIYDKPITKYSIAVDNPVVAEQAISEMKPLHLNITVTILLLKNNGYEELFFK